MHRPQTVELAISGMTCASCATRLEKVLGKVDGVETASVNLASERARVVSYPGTPIADLVARSKLAGYGFNSVVRAIAEGHLRMTERRRIEYGAVVAPVREA